MHANGLSRRDFAWVLGTGFGSALLQGSPLGAKRAFGQHFPERPVGMTWLDSNENPYGPGPKALEAMARSQGAANRYPDNAAESMTAAIASHHGLSPRQVALGCGSSEILKAVDLAFAAPGTRVVAAEPTFEAVLNYAKVTRAETLKVPLTADARHDLPQMAASCDASTHLVYVCNPNNPTGTLVTFVELKEFLSKVPPSTVVLLDEAYHHFVEEPSYRSGVESLQTFPNLVVVRTFSKIYGLAGMRLGYALGSEANIKAISKHLAFSNANAAVLEAALSSLADQGHVEDQRKRIGETRRWLCEELDKDGRRYIRSHTNFLMIHTGGDVGPVIEAFHKRGILVGRRFASMAEWLRVSIGTPEETRAFLVGLREIRPKTA